VTSVTNSSESGDPGAFSIATVRSSSSTEPGEEEAEEEESEEEEAEEEESEEEEDGAGASLDAAGFAASPAALLAAGFAASCAIAGPIRQKEKNIKRAKVKRPWVRRRRGDKFINIIQIPKPSLWPLAKERVSAKLKLRGFYD
jgi:hypothetical protein